MHRTRSTLLALTTTAAVALACGEHSDPQRPPQAELTAPAPQTQPEVPARPERAAAAVAALRSQLGAALSEGLAESPEAAIGACRVKAPAIAAAVAGPGVTVGRTSHRLRNPSNAPEPWMLPFLEEFAAGEPQPGAFRSVSLGERGTGYVEPIYLQPPCATCHGEAVDPGLLAKIREHYPEDEATGFRVGELRGLFWAVVGD